MDIRAKIKIRDKWKWKWPSSSSSSSSSFKPHHFLSWAIVALLALCFLANAVPVATGSALVTHDARTLRRRSSPYAQNLGKHPIRRRLSFGPGSYPPRCMYKCGRCAPCYPIHVPVPPGTLFFPTEYYPEAWRCKCGNRLYMP